MSEDSTDTWLIDGLRRVFKREHVNAQDEKAVDIAANVHTYEVVKGRSVEVGYADKLDGLALIYEVPVYHKEWRNGRLFDHMEAYLKQRTTEGKPVEINYSVNHSFSSQSQADLEASEEYQDSQAMVSFIRDVVSVQQLTLNGDGEGDEHDKAREDAQLIIDAEEDPKKKELLTLAQKKARQVAISYIDTTHISLYQFEDLGYGGLGGRIQGEYRTLGMDYAIKRGAEIIHLSDIDTVPSSHTASRRLIEYYDLHPDMKFHIGNLSYRLTGDKKDIFSTSPPEIMSRTTNYNTKNTASSTQLTFRRDTAIELNQIGTMSAHFSGVRGFTNAWEDSDTATHLRVIAGDKEGIPEYSYPAFTAMTSDREDGFCDGTARMHEGGKSALIKDFQKVNDHLDKIKDRITDELEEDKSYIVLDDLERCRDKYKRETMKKCRMHRLGARSFIEALDDGSIEVSEEGYRVADKDGVSDSVLKYMEQNRELFKQLEPKDVEYLKKLLGMENSFEDETLSPFRIALREWFGEYRNLDDVVNSGYVSVDGQKYIDKREIGSDGDNVSLLYAMEAEILAVGEIYRKYFVQKDAWKEFRSEGLSDEQIREVVKGNVNIKPFEERTKWLEGADLEKIHQQHEKQTVPA